jgi:hypothetical protein
MPEQTIQVNGKGIPLPMLFVAIFGTIVLALLFMGIGYVIDWVIWMWNN